MGPTNFHPRFFRSFDIATDSGEVETLCDRAIMIHQGKIVTEASVSELMEPLNRFEISFRSSNGDELPESIAALGPEREGDSYHLVVRDVEAYSNTLRTLSTHDFTVQQASSQTRSLENYFVELVREQEPAS